MGCDIHGFVEFSEKGEFWESIINIGAYVGRNYDIFGLLFGVRNYCNFQPIAKGRGLPDGIGSVTQLKHEDDEDDVHSETWVGFDEIKNIDWNKEGLAEDGRIHTYVVADGKLVSTGKASSYGDISVSYLKSRGLTKLKKDKTIYKIEKVKQLEALSKDWEELFELVQFILNKGNYKLARLVVWFDN